MQGFDVPLWKKILGRKLTGIAFLNFYTNLNDLN